MSEYTCLSTSEYRSLSIWEFLCIFILGSWLLFYIYICIKYPFWAHQPVCHIYDLFRRTFFSKPYIIQSKKPIKTKYVDLENITTKPFLELASDELDIIIEYIQCHYLSSENSILMLSKNLLSYMMCAHLEPAYISVLYENSFKMVLNENTSETNVTKIVPEKRPLGVMCSYPLHFYFVHDEDSAFQSISYWDYICIHRDNIEKKNVHKLLQTHDFIQRSKSNLRVSLFRKEGDPSAGIVPLIEYTSYLFSLHSVGNPPKDPHTTCERIGKDNFHLISDIMYSMSRGQTDHYIELSCFPALSAIQERINHDIYFVYVIRKRDIVLGAFFFQDTFHHIEEEGSVLECGACFTNMIGKPAEDTFFAYFLTALNHLQKNVEKRFSLLQLNDIGHGILLVDKWRWKYTPIQVTNCEYYLYNASTSKMPIHKQYCFMLS